MTARLAREPATHRPLFSPSTPPPSSIRTALEIVPSQHASRRRGFGPGSRWPDAARPGPESGMSARAAVVPCSPPLPATPSTAVAAVLGSATAAAPRFAAGCEQVVRHWKRRLACSRRRSAQHPSPPCAPERSRHASADPGCTSNTSGRQAGSLLLVRNLRVKKKTQFRPLLTTGMNGCNLNADLTSTCKSSALSKGSWQRLQ